MIKRVPIVHFRLLERPTGGSDAEKSPFPLVLSPSPPPQA